MGMFVQPYLGLCSDRSRISWGKRRPYILGGAVGITIGLLALAWVRDIVEIVAWILLIPQNGHELQIGTLVTAAMSLWTLIFSVQPIQFGLRALIVDRCTTEQMNEANAWAGRMVGIGSLLGYLMQYIRFERDNQSVDDVQFKTICLVVSAVLLVLVFTTCACIREQDPNQEKQTDEVSNPLTKIIEIWKSILNLSPDVQAICQVQFCSWFGWYSFMFYATTYVGEICKSAPADHTMPKLTGPRYPAKIRLRWRRNRSTVGLPRECAPLWGPCLSHIFNREHDYHHSRALAC